MGMGASRVKPHGLAPIFNARGFAQATLRHVFFGTALARLAR